MASSERADWIGQTVAAYEGRLVRYAARLTGDLERARDVVQETFLRLCTRKRSAVEPHLAEWLFTVCRNRALDVRKKEKRMALYDQHLDEKAGPAPPPEAGAEARETRSRVLQALGALPEDQQEVIRLKFQEGVSYQEIGRITRRSVSNVGYLIHQGLVTLRRRFKADPRPARNS